MGNTQKWALGKDFEFLGIQSLILVMVEEWNSVSLPVGYLNKTINVKRLGKCPINED